MPYLKHFGFINHPFSLENSPFHYFNARKHGLLLDILEKKVRTHSGLFKIISTDGTGKSSFCDFLNQLFSVNDSIAFLQPTQQRFSLLEQIGKAFGLRTFEIVNILDYAERQKKQGKNTIILIDNAQKLSLKELQTLNELLIKDKNKRLKIILFGTLELNKQIFHNDLEEIIHATVFSYRLTPFSFLETMKYIRTMSKNTQITGLQQKVFSFPALLLLALTCHGKPKTINIICNIALDEAYSQNAKTVSFWHVLRAVIHRKDLTSPYFPKRWLLVLASVFVGIAIYFFSSHILQWKRDYIDSKILLKKMEQQQVKLPAPNEKDDIF